MKITTSLTKYLHQDCGPCYLHLAIFFLCIHTCVVLKNRNSCCDCCFPQQIRPQITFQLWILLAFLRGETGNNFLTNSQGCLYIYFTVNIVSFVWTQICFLPPLFCVSVLELVAQWVKVLHSESERSWFKPH